MGRLRLLRDGETHLLISNFEILHSHSPNKSRHINKFHFFPPSVSHQIWTEFKHTPTFHIQILLPVFFRLCILQGTPLLLPLHISLKSQNSTVQLFSPAYCQSQLSHNIQSIRKDWILLFLPENYQMETHWVFLIG